MERIDNYKFIIEDALQDVYEIDRIMYILRAKKYLNNEGLSNILDKTQIENECRILDVAIQQIFDTLSFIRTK